MQKQGLLHFLKIHLIVHVVSGHHNDFALGNGIGVVMVHEHAIDDSIAERLYFGFIALSQLRSTLRVKLIH